MDVVLFTVYHRPQKVVWLLEFISGEARRQSCQRDFCIGAISYSGLGSALGDIFASVKGKER